MPSRRLIPVAVAAVLVAAACGSGSGDDAGSGTATTVTTASSPSAPPTASSPTVTTAPTVSTAPASTAPTDGAISSFADVQPAAIQIQAAGTLRDPAAGYSDGSGSGSGFIISEDGLAVTNNHVVTGAATLEVFVGGDTSKSYNASIVGVSECNDLALIDISEDGPLPTLEWYDGEIDPGLEVYAAGFPLGDPEFTLTSGIVSKATADGDVTGRSSIDATIEHDANLQPGNSGGALVDDSGRVVAVNYAKGPDVTNTSQFYAISAELARPIVEELRRGDVESIGINGWAVFDEALGLTGIWVAGVAPGSPAADVGLLPGDVITQLNGLPMGIDGSMRDYCDVIRTAGDRPIAIQALRYDTGEVFRGEVGGAALELAFSLSGSVEESAAPTPDEDGDVYTDFVPITDDTGTIGISVPAAWSDVIGSPLTLDDGTTLPFLLAAPTVVGLTEGWTTPGLFMTLFAGSDDIVTAMAQFAPAAGDCGTPTEDVYEDDTFRGEFALYPSCGGTDTANLVLAVTPTAQPQNLVVLGVQLVTRADMAALDTLLTTFQVAA